MAFRRYQFRPQCLRCGDRAIDRCQRCGTWLCRDHIEHFPERVWPNFICAPCERHRRAEILQRLGMLGFALLMVLTVTWIAWML